MTAAPAARLRLLAEYLRAGLPVERNDADFVADTLESYIAGEVLKVAPGQRRPSTVVAIDERDELIREAAARFFPDLKASAQARKLADALALYASTTWSRERADDICPPRHVGTLREVCWKDLRLRDHALSERAIRAILALS